MLKHKLKNCQFSGLTDVRTVSYELTESSFFMADSDQTLHSVANLFDLEKNELQQMIQDSMPVPEEYDLEAASKWQKEVENLCKSVLARMKKTFEEVEQAQARMERQALGATESVETYVEKVMEEKVGHLAKHIVATRKKVQSKMKKLHPFRF